MNNNGGYLPGTVTTPSTLEIVSITQAYPMVATVEVDPITASNTYMSGQTVKFVIPFGYGMQQVNGMIAKIILVSGNVITLNVDSRGFDPFSVPASGQKPASMGPYGSNNLEFSNLTGELPFQSLNNRGN